MSYLGEVGLVSGVQGLYLGNVSLASGSAVPAGDSSSGQVLYNDAGAITGDNGLKYEEISTFPKTLKVGEAFSWGDPTVQTGVTVAGDYAYGYSGLTIQNKNTANTASCNTYLCADSGTEISNYGVLGINGSNYNGGNYMDGSPLNVYVGSSNGDISVLPNFAAGGGNINLAYDDRAKSIQVTNAGSISVGTTYDATTNTYTRNEGTVNQVLTSNGAGAAVTWTDATTDYSTLTATPCSMNSGIVSWNYPTLSWSTYMSVGPVNTEFGTAGAFQLNADSVNLPNANSALYYAPPFGSGFGYNSAYLQIVDAASIGTDTIGKGWILLAVTDGAGNATATLKWMPNLVVMPPNSTYNGLTQEASWKATGLYKNSLYVNDGVNTIQSAIDASNQADVIYVSAGSYGERLVLDGKINIAIQAPVVGSTICEVLNGIELSNTTESIRIVNLQVESNGFNSVISGVGRYVFENVVFKGTALQPHTITVGDSVAQYITFRDCEFDSNCSVVVANTFTGIIYFINCNFGGANYANNTLNPTRVIFSNCANLLSYPTITTGTTAGIMVGVNTTATTSKITSTTANFGGDVAVAGGSVSITGSSSFMKLPVYTNTSLTAITGQVGWIAAVSNSASGGNPNGMMAFWDTTNSRWSYIHDNSAV